MPYKVKVEPALKVVLTLRMFTADVERHKPTDVITKEEGLFPLPSPVLYVVVFE